MESKKNPKFDLTSKRGLFFNIGLVIALLFVISAFEYRSYDDADLMILPLIIDNIDEVLDVPVTEQPPPPPPAPKNIQIIEIPDVEEIEEEIEINLDIEITEETVIEEIVFEESAEVEEEAEQIFLIVEQAPMPKDGYAAFYKNISDKLKYPRQAQSMSIEGKVFVQFVVDRDGSITDVVVVRGIGGGCDEEAIRVVKQSPSWKAGKQRGRTVRVRMVLPITFKIM